MEIYKTIRRKRRKDIAEPENHGMERYNKEMATDINDRIILNL